MDEQAKQRVLLSVVAFNLAVIIASLILWVLNPFREYQASTAFWLTVVICVPIGVVAGAIAYFLTGMSQ